jgi:hypothetical protein
LFSCDIFCCNDQIAFIFAILVIHDDDKFIGSWICTRFLIFDMPYISLFFSYRNLWVPLLWNRIRHSFSMLWKINKVGCGIF